MSLINDYHTIDTRKLQLKNPIKRIINEEPFYFIPLRIRKNPIYIKTPKIVVPFGLNSYTDNFGNVSHSYVLSFTDADIDPNIEGFAQFLHKIETFCCECVKTHYKQWCIGGDFDKLRFKPSIKDYNGTELFRLRIYNNCTELYDVDNRLQPLNQLENMVVEQCQIISLIELCNIWINTTEYGITWKVTQMKVYPINKPVSGVSLLNETFTILDSDSETQSSLLLPPPPPPPPANITASQLLKKHPTMVACFAMISNGQFNLKKVDHINNPQHITSHQPLITLTDILSVKSRLRKNITQ